MTPEFRNSAATLIMGLIKSDGEIRSAEIDAAYEKLNDMGGKDDTNWSAGDNSVIGRSSGNRIADALGALRFAPEEDRLDLLAALWDVAAADGELHKMEAEFVQTAAEALDLTPGVVEIVRPAGLATKVVRTRGKSRRKKRKAA